MSGIFLQLLASATPVSVSYFVMAGGGGGGYLSSSTQGHGGGGGGGHQISSATLDKGTSYTVTVGAGGAGDTAGSDSSLIA